MSKINLKLLLGAVVFGVLIMPIADLFAQSSKTSTFVLEDLKAVSSSDGEELSMPTWSPDGSMLLTATTHGSKLRLIDLKENNTLYTISEVRGSGFDASWSVDGTEVLYRHKDDERQSHPEIKSYSLTKKKFDRTNLNPNGLLSASKAVDAKDPVVFINTETLGIEAHTKDETACWNITDDNKQYYRPLLSPDKTKLIIHNGPDMLLYAVDGSGLIQNLGTALASSWSPDGKYVLAFLDSSNDGHVISGSEMYLIDIEAGTTSLLTNTPDLNEMWPSWSPDGKQIAFEDEKTGTIFIANIKKQ